jgi:transposase
MKKVTICGCDLHDRNMLVKYAVNKGNPKEKSFPNTLEGRQAMIGFLHTYAQERNSNEIVFVYEASGQGFGLYDLLWDHRIVAHVLSPAHLPRTAKSRRNKTDSRDAQMLFEQARGHVLAGNDLPMVWVPPQALRDDRELMRARLEAAEALTQIKLKIFTLLKRYQIVLPDWFCRNRSWTRAFVDWLRKTAENMAVVLRPVLQEFIVRFETLRRSITDLERHIRHLAKTDRYKEAYKSLRAIPGVGMLTAMVFLTEIGDPGRFSNRRQLAAYLGLCPSAFESGDQDDRKGHITHQGPGRLRKVLCQAAWAAIRTDPETRKSWERIKGDRPGRAKKAVVAIMRRMAIRMWHLSVAAGTAAELVNPTWSPPPPRRKTSARAQQKGAVPSASPSPRPHARAG